MSNRRKLVLAFVFAALACLAAVSVGAAAFGSPTDHDRSIGAIKVVEPCTAAQAHANDGRGALGEHGDAYYRCRETTPGCYQWKWQYDGRPKTGKTWSRPTCPACSPSPSHSVTPSHTASHHASPSPSHTSGSASAAASPSASQTESPRPPAVTSPAPVPVDDTLPVTGLPASVAFIGALGVLAILAGAGLLLIPFRRHNP